MGSGNRGASATDATPPVLVAHLSNDPDVAWLVNGLAAKDGIKPRVREQPPAAAGRARWGHLAHRDQSSRPP